MKRPLEQLTPEKVAAADNLYKVAEKMLFPSLSERMWSKLLFAFERAVCGPMRVVHCNNSDSYTKFSGKDDLFARLSLDLIHDQLKSGHVVHLPENTQQPDLRANRHFSQMGAVWEPRNKYIKSIGALRLEIGSGFHLLSLGFCPDLQDSEQRRLQLDELIVYNGHEQYYLDIEDTKNEATIQYVITQASVMVKQLACGQADIEPTLSEIKQRVKNAQTSESADTPDVQSYTFK